ncbi:hypothetical protein Hanom_Chr01g00077131 [Helianthus anomalus]
MTATWKGSGSGRRPVGDDDCVWQNICVIDSLSAYKHLNCKPNIQATSSIAFNTKLNVQLIRASITQLYDKKLKNSLKGGADLGAEDENHGD